MPLKGEGPTWTGASSYCWEPPRRSDSYIRRSVSTTTFRPSLSVLARPDEEDAVVATLFKETTTLGVRIGALRRQKLEREIVEVDTRFGPVVVKMSTHDGRIANAAPEYESVRKIALERGIPLKDVYDEVATVARAALDGSGDGDRSELPTEGAEA